MMFAATLQAQDYGALKHMLQKRPANEKFESNKFNEHLFFSAGIGKWFSRFSGLRLSGTVGLYDTPSGSESGYFKHVDLHADYMLNINNILWGYDEDRLFTLMGIAGVNLSGTKGVEKTAKYAQGVGVGVQGSFRLNRSVDLFVEPRLNVYQPCLYFQIRSPISTGY